MSARSLAKCLRKLDKYGAQCVKTGGIVPRTDANWQRLTQRLIKAHNRWAQRVEFPPLAPEPDNLRNLLPWLRRQSLNGRQVTWLAEVLCHIDVARSLESWAEDVIQPLDPWWPQDQGPKFVRVPTGAWDLVTEGKANSDWILGPIAELKFLGMPPGERNLENPLESDHEDTLRLLPGLLVTRWLTLNFTDNRSARDLRQKVDLLDKRSRADAADLGLWDGLTNS